MLELWETAMGAFSGAEGDIGVLTAIGSGTEYIPPPRGVQFSNVAMAFLIVHNPGGTVKSLLSAGLDHRDRSLSFFIYVDARTPVPADRFYSW
jgi:hypothetical protein